jgi:hypothetical protein
VAWNGSVQAGRALRAAMPYLRKADQVTVLQRSGSNEDAELKRYLSADAIKSVVFKSYGQDHLSARGWGRALLAETQAVGADLLVMGAYGSSMGNPGVWPSHREDRYLGAGAGAAQHLTIGPPGDLGKGHAAAAQHHMGVRSALILSLDGPSRTPAC